MSELTLTEPRPISEAERQRRANFSRASVKHGAYRTPEYWAWLSMKQRCSNPKHPCFKHYGARGITVCAEWRANFESFIADMGKRPTDKHTLERIDNNKGYEPTNCAWIHCSKQSSNTRRSILVTLKGVTRCMKEWCRILGKDYKSITARLRKYGGNPKSELLKN